MIDSAQISDQRLQANSSYDYPFILDYHAKWYTQNYHAKLSASLL